MIFTIVMVNHLKKNKCAFRGGDFHNDENHDGAYTTPLGRPFLPRSWTNPHSVYLAQQWFCGKRRQFFAFGGFFIDQSTGEWDEKETIILDDQILEWNDHSVRTPFRMENAAASLSYRTADALKRVFKPEEMYRRWTQASPGLTLCLFRVHSRAV